MFYCDRYTPSLTSELTMSQETTLTVDLDDDHARRMYHREWFVERLGWLLIAATLALAVLGYLGPGLLNRTDANSDALWTVEYDRIQRYKAPAELRFKVRPEANQSRIVLEISRAFTDNTTLSSITPAPVVTEVREGRIAFLFEAGRLSADVPLVYRYENDTFGNLAYTISLNGGSPMTLSHFTCP
jgi:hypothetical protein